MQTFAAIQRATFIVQPTGVHHRGEIITPGIVRPKTLPNPPMAEIINAITVLLITILDGGLNFLSKKAHRISPRKGPPQTPKLANAKFIIVSPIELTKTDKT